MKEIGKIDSVNVQSCDVLIEKSDGTVFTINKKGEASQNWYNAIFYLFNRTRIYRSVHIISAIQKAECFIDNLVKQEYIMIHNELVKYQDIKTVKIINIKDCDAVPEYEKDWEPC